MSSAVVCGKSLIPDGHMNDFCSFRTRVSSSSAFVTDPTDDDHEQKKGT